MLNVVNWHNDGGTPTIENIILRLNDKVDHLDQNYYYFYNYSNNIVINLV